MQKQAAGNDTVTTAHGIVGEWVFVGEGFAPPATQGDARVAPTKTDFDSPTVSLAKV
jgi:hypothetical protein